MKIRKGLWIGIFAAAGLLLVVVGPALLDLYRLQNYIATSSKADEVDGGPWPRLSDECTLCHGVRGNAQDQRYPRLAGQPAAYLAAQLRSFASSARVAPAMGPLAMTLSDADIEALSQYFAKQQPDRNPSFTADANLREQGRVLVTNLNCAACHGVSMRGQAQFPRLAGQGNEYLEAQLAAYAAGARKDPTGAMNGLAATLSVEDRKAIAEFLAATRQKEAI